MSIYFSGLAIFDMRNDFTVEFLDFFTSSIDVNHDAKPIQSC